MPTVEELSAPFENYLLPVLAASAGVCPICHTAKEDGFPFCYQCDQARRILGDTTDALGFVALAAKDNQFARDLWVYKSPEIGSIAQRTQLGLAAVLWRWLKLHESCVAREAGTEEFEVVTSIPSIKRPSGHPLETVVSSLVQPTADRYQVLLSPNPHSARGHILVQDRFTVTMSLSGIKSILIVDDTFTMGSRVQGASFALKNAGVETVGAVCLGRHLAPPSSEPYRQLHLDYLKSAKQLGWSWDTCALCR